MMRKFTIVGGGQSGLMVAIGLVKAGHKVRVVQNRTGEEIAWDSHDTHDLSAEESAMHYEEDGGEEDNLSDDVLHDLEGFEA